MDKECKYCGDLFVPRRKDQEYCKSSHRVAFTRKKTLHETQKAVTKPLHGKNVTCEFCKKIIKDALPLQRFHLPECWHKKVKEINKTLESRGLPKMIRGSDYPEIEFVSSGIKEIDELTRGFPRKRITEIFGLKGVGKSSLMLSMLKNLPQLTIYYVDSENALRNPPDNVEVHSEFILEKVHEAVEVQLQSQSFDLIVIDSVASLVPRAELEGDAGDAQMGLKARLMGQWMRKINYHLSKSPKTAVVFINQQRDTMSQWGSVKFTPGGYALPYAASLRLELKSKKADKKENYQDVEVIVEKSRFSKPYKKTNFKLVYS